MTDYASIDADGHVMETDDDLRRHLPAPFDSAAVKKLILRDNCIEFYSLKPRKS
jgi:hypothetical protein